VPKTGRPAGYNTYKVIATTSQVDLSFLEQPRLTLKDLKGDITPLQALLNQAYGKERDLGSTEIDVGNWTTSQINLAINGDSKP
jgi:hypothetical protein